MANVGWSAGIDFVSGALSKPSKNGQHSCQKMLLGTHRVAATTNPNCNRIYLRPKIERSTPPTVNELFMRQRFAAVKAAVKARMEDLSKVDADQAAFIAQKDTAGGKRTMNARTMQRTRAANRTSAKGQSPYPRSPLNTGGSAFFCHFSKFYSKVR